MQRKVRRNDAQEALVVEQALAMYRELRQAARAARDGEVLAVTERLTVERARELGRAALEAVLGEQAAELEKKGRRAGAATADASDATAGAARAGS